MHFDLAHALVSASIILAVILGMRKLGYVKEHGKWSWPLFIAVFVVMFILNTLWPYPA